LKSKASTIVAYSANKQEFDESGKSAGQHAKASRKMLHPDIDMITRCCQKIPYAKSLSPISLCEKTAYVH